MANGGCLPKFMAKMNKRTNSPLNAVIFIIALSVVLTLLFHFSGIDMNTVVKISNFGALSTYVMLNVSVIVFCWFQLKQRKGAKSRVHAPGVPGARRAGVLCDSDVRGAPWPW